MGPFFEFTSARALCFVTAPVAGRMRLGGGGGSVTGSGYAQFALGDLYFRGRGVANGYAEALQWYRQAAAQGHPMAQYRLGVMYAEGWAGGFDAIRAYKWFSLSLRGQDRITAFDPELDAQAGLEHVAGKMNDNQIKRAKEAVANWRPKR